MPRAERPMAPLLQPADCCVIVVDPSARHLSRIDRVRHLEPARRLHHVIEAALAAAVPIHIAFSDSPANLEEWAISPRPPPEARVHSLGTAGSSWSRSGLHEALTAERRNSLILSGFWLEATVTFLALPALASGFEVFVLMDAAPASSDVSARPAIDRLLQAGIVPITTRQLIAEWIEASPDGGARSALSLLASAD